jgi:iron-sulfur cluster assembly accessory protein
MLRMTPAAVAHARALAASRGVPAALRVRVVGGGCAGLTVAFQFGMVGECEGDTSRAVEDVSVVVDGRSAKSLRGAVVDLGAASTTRLREPIEPGPTDFVIRGLAGRRTCGCGESFEP